MCRHPFDLLMELRGEHIRLDCAALHLARDVYPRIDIGQYVRQLDDLAQEVAHRRPGLAATLRYQAMRDVLVEAHGFAGDPADDRNPQNSYLNRALDRRVGNPITLSVIWIEVGRRLKWPVSGVALPDHFLVRFDDPERFVLADPFGEGQSLSVNECRCHVGGRLDRKIKLTGPLLKPLNTRTILARMLSNLRSLYLERRDWRQLTTVLHRLAALEPHDGRHLQDLASVRARLGDMRGAYGYLTVYLHRLPNADDHQLVQGNLERLKAAIAALN